MSKKYILLLIAGFTIIGLALLPGKEKTEAIFFDVGQGDSYAFRTNDGRVILIDGGPDWSSLYGLGRWLNYFEREIDIVLLTHTHSDHLSALPEILKRYRVKKIILPNNLNGSGAKSLLESLGTDTELIYPREEFCFDFNSDCYFCVLPPSQRFEDSKDDNDLSLASYFNCGGLRVFGAGDAPGPREREIINSDLVSSCDVLKISHHGSKDSSDEDFLDFFSPQIAIISAGKNNSYKHPHEELIHRLDLRALKTLRTDLDGSVVFYANNKELFYKRLGW